MKLSWTIFSTFNLTSKKIWGGKKITDSLIFLMFPKNKPTQNQHAYQPCSPIHSCVTEAPKIKPPQHQTKANDPTPLQKKEKKEEI